MKLNLIGPHCGYLARTCWRLLILLIPSLMLSCTLISSPVEKENTGAETWEIVEIVNQRQREDVAFEEVEVRHCNTPERKSISCSAGTSRDFYIEGAAEVTLGVVSVGASVGSGLGFGQDSGEELGLDTPSEGYVYRYTVQKTYRIISGNVLARSATGEEQQTEFGYNASCSQNIISVEELTCEEARANPVGPIVSLVDPVEITPGATVIMTIYADRPRNETGIDLFAGQLVSIEYIEGSWRAGPLPSWPLSGPSGDLQVAGKETFPVSDKPIMSLVAGVGNEVPFYTGGQIVFESPASGQLWLGANDDEFSDNVGQIVVKISIEE